MGRICKLVEELLLEILLRLPAESVLESKVVCKRWYALIKDSAFAAKHLHYSTTITSSSTTLLLTGHDSLAAKYAICSLTIPNVGLDGGSDDHVINSVVDQESRPLHALYVISHCNGIFLLSLAPYSELILWNPTIKEVKLLPNPIPSCSGYYQKAVGFGYDSNANEYKVVNILSVGKATIYTTSSDCWREIEKPIQFYPRTQDQDQVYCEGVCYWLFWNLQNKVTLLWFDMCDEKFGTIELPISANQKEGIYKKNNRLMLRNDTVVLLSYPGVLPAASIAIEMWVLNGCCWIKLGTIGPIWLSRTIAFWKSDELLFENGSGEYVSSYNLRTKNIRNISFGTMFRSFEVFPYVKSLVSLKRGNKLDRLSTFEPCLNFMQL